MKFILFNKRWSKCTNKEVASKSSISVNKVITFSGTSSQGKKCMLIAALWGWCFPWRMFQLSALLSWKQSDKMHQAVSPNNYVTIYFQNIFNTYVSVNLTDFFFGDTYNEVTNGNIQDFYCKDGSSVLLTYQLGVQNKRTCLFYQAEYAAENGYMYTLDSDYCEKQIFGGSFVCEFYP